MLIPPNPEAIFSFDHSHVAANLPSTNVCVRVCGGCGKVKDRSAAPCFTLFTNKKSLKYNGGFHFRVMCFIFHLFFFLSLCLSLTYSIHSPRCHIFSFNSTTSSEFLFCSFEFHFQFVCPFLLLLFHLYYTTIFFVLFCVEFTFFWFFCIQM